MRTSLVCICCRSAIAMILLSSSRAPAAESGVIARDVVRLLSQLDDHRVHVRRQAVNDLWRVSGPGIDAALTKRLTVERDSQVLLALRKALALRGDVEQAQDIYRGFCQGAGCGWVLNDLFMRPYGNQRDLWDMFFRYHGPEQLRELLKTRRARESHDPRAWNAFRAAVRTLQQEGDRGKAAESFHEVQRDFPDSFYAPQARELSEQLRKMVAEDHRWQEPDDVTSLGVAQKIEYHVYHLRDIFARQFSDPGSLSAFALQPDGAVNPAVQLRGLGEAAIPALLALLDDRRPIRAVGHRRTFDRDPHVLRYQDAAVEILNALLPERFYRPNRSGGYFSNEPAELRAEMIAWLRAYWKSAADKDPIQRKWIAVRSGAGIYQSLRLLESLAAEAGQREAVLAELRRMYDGRHWAYRPKIALKMGELGDRSKVAEVLREADRGRYVERITVWLPDDGCALANAAEDVRRLRKLSGTAGPPEPMPTPFRAKIVNQRLEDETALDLDFGKSIGSVEMKRIRGHDAFNWYDLRWDHWDPDEVDAGALTAQMDVLFPLPKAHSYEEALQQGLASWKDSRIDESLLAAGPDTEVPGGATKPARFYVADTDWNHLAVVELEEYDRREAHVAWRLFRVVEAKDGKPTAKPIRSLSREKDDLEFTWGKAVEGVQCRLQPDKTPWMTDEVPKLEAYVRHLRDGGLWLSYSQKLNGCRLEVDGVWYEWGGAVLWTGPAYGHSKSFEAENGHLDVWGADLNSIPPNLNAWRSVEGEKWLRWTPGEHTVRFAWATAQSPDGDQPTRLISNAVEIQIARQTPLADAEPGARDFVGETATSAPVVESARTIRVPKWPRIELRPGVYVRFGKFESRPWDERIGTFLSGPWQPAEVEDGVIELSQGTALRLSIDSGNYTDLSVLDALGPNDLQVLALPAANRIGSDAMRHIGRLTGLQALFLGGADVRDTDLKHLAGLNELKALHLQDCPLTDDAVGPIASMKSVRHLNLWGTAITRDGCRQLKESLPQCRIDWEERFRKPLTQSRQSELIAAWGDAVAGAQCRLAPEKTRWAADEVPRLTAYVRDLRDGGLWLENPPEAGARVQVDGDWYRWGGPVVWTGDPLCRSDRRGPLTFTLTGDWQKTSDKSPLKLSPGKHSVRFAYEANRSLEGTGGPDQKEHLLLVSNPVEIDILPAKELPWGKPAEGVQCRLRPENVTWPLWDVGDLGKAPKFKIDVRSRSKQMYEGTPPGSGCDVHVEWDGKWYEPQWGEYTGPVWRVGPGTDSLEEFSLDAGGVAGGPDGTDQQNTWGIKPTAGWHTIRIAIQLFGETGISVVSNPVKIEIVPTDDEKASWGEPRGGLRCRWVPHIGPVTDGAAIPIIAEVENVSDEPVIWECMSKLTWMVRAPGNQSWTNVVSRVKLGPSARLATAREVSDRFGVGSPDRKGDDPVEGYYRLEPAGRLVLSAVLPGKVEKPGDYKIDGQLALRDPRTNRLLSKDEWLSSPPLALRVIAKATDEGNALAATEPASKQPGHATFGPVIERVVTEQPSKATTYLDLDTGKHVAPQLDTIAVPIGWLREHGVDLRTSGAESERTLRTTVDMVISQYTKDAWSESADWTPEQAREFIVGNLARHKPSSGQVIGTPGTFAFRTREGSVGIMQLLPPPEDKPEVTVRYKLLKASTAEVDKTSWGPAVDGVQCRLRLEKTTWAVPQPLHPDTPLRMLAKIDFRNGSEQTWSTVPLELAAQHLQWDGKWHSMFSRAPLLTHRPVRPGQLVRDLDYALGDAMTGAMLDDSSDPIGGHLDVGRHTVRVVVYLASGDRQIKVVSNPVEIEIVPGKPGNAAFGPVIERPITADSSKATTYLDLETGKYAAPGADAFVVPIGWLRKRGVDLRSSEAESVPTSRTAVDMVLAQLPDTAFGASCDWTSGEARKTIARSLEGGNPSPGRVIGAPGVYAFRTREGSLGIMQLVPPPKNKPEVTVRYKLLKASTGTPN